MHRMIVPQTAERQTSLLSVSYMTRSSHPTRLATVLTPTLQMVDSGGRPTGHGTTALQHLESATV
jgi:hypothetical protein